MKILCDISLGELVDKMTILMIKVERIPDQSKIELAKKELTLLEATLNSFKLQGMSSYLDRLKSVNEELWIIEDDIREKETVSKFDREFIDLARAVYKTNDLRFEIKKEININFGSEIVEVKSYKGS